MHRDLLAKGSGNLPNFKSSPPLPHLVKAAWAYPALHCLANISGNALDAISLAWPRLKGIKIVLITATVLRFAW